MDDVPELPEVEALAEFLRARAVDRVVASVGVGAISVLKTYDPPVTALAGLTVTSVTRHGKFLDLDVDGLHLVMHLARAGWLRWSEQLPTGPVKPGKSPLALRVRLDDGSGFDLTEQGTQKRLAVYVTREPATIEGVARLGPDPFSPEFTLEAFESIIEAHPRSQLKGLLRDQSVIAGIGNAYSDEILHVAKMSPFKPAGNLRPDERDRLYEAVVSTLADAVERPVGWPPVTSRRRRRPGSGACPDRAGVPGVRRHHPRGLLRRLLPAVLPDLPDRGQAARRPPAVQTPAMSGVGA